MAISTPISLDNQDSRYTDSRRLTARLLRGLAQFFSRKFVPVPLPRPIAFDFLRAQKYPPPPQTRALFQKNITPSHSITSTPPSGAMACLQAM